MRARRLHDNERQFDNVAREKKQIAKNRKAFHEYDILETFEVGVVLSGTEVCSLRENNCQLTDCFALIRHGEVWHRNQIRYLEEKTRERGMALVPLNIYFAQNGLVKIELAVARGKKLYDKRASMAERDSKREIERALKARLR